MLNFRNGLLVNGFANPQAAEPRNAHSVVHFPSRTSSLTSTHFPEIIGENEAAEAFVQQSALKKSCELGVAAGAKFGRDFRAPLKYKQWMMEVGFVDIHEEQILVPVNVWPLDPVERRLGGWFSLDVQKGIRSSAKLLETAGMAAADIPAFEEEVCRSVTDQNMRAYSPRKCS